jgi:hypothetical protein
MIADFRLLAMGGRETLSDGSPLSILTIEVSAQK